MFNRKINEADELPKGSLAHAPVLTIRASSEPTRAVVLVLHGGRANSYEPVRARHLSPSRMIPFARLLHRWGAPHGLAVWSLRNRVRGWNGEERSPIQDARWALEKIHLEHPQLPIYLIGHSMGGSVALGVADDSAVDTVVSLAPWTDQHTPTDSIRDRKVLILHGDQDRWTSAPYSQQYAERAAPACRELFYVKLRGAGHFMFSKVPIWHKLSASFILRDFAMRFQISLAPKITEAADRLYQSPSRLPIEM